MLLQRQVVSRRVAPTASRRTVVNAIPKSVDPLAVSDGIWRQGKVLGIHNEKDLAKILEEQKERLTVLMCKSGCLPRCLLARLLPCSPWVPGLDVLQPCLQAHTAGHARSSCSRTTNLQHVSRCVPWPPTDLVYSSDVRHWFTSVAVGVPCMHRIACF